MQIRNIQLTRTLAISSAYALVVASAGFGAVYAYRVGIQHSILLAGLSVLMALGLEGVKPLAIAYALKAKNLITALLLACLGFVAVAYSLTSELSLLASSKSDLAAHRGASAEAAREAVGSRQRMAEELRSLGIQRPSNSVRAELSPLLSDKRLNNCEGWLANYRLREICIDKVAPLKAELAKAERREKLETDLGKSADHDGVHVSSADPGSAALVTYLALLGITISAEAVAQWLLLVPVLALELGSAMAMVLVGAVQVQQVVQPKEPAKPQQLRDTTAQQIVDRLKAQGGSGKVSERSLAEALGTSRPTVRRALNGLVLAGMVGLEASRSGTLMRLI